MIVHDVEKNTRGRSSRRRSRDNGLISEINVTPMVDVMLVLLIIFMVTAPMLASGVNVDLPQARSKPIPTKDDEPLEISIKKDETIFIQKTQIELGKLGAKLAAITGQKTDTHIFIRGDRSIDYGYIIKVINAVSSAGFEKIGLVTELPD